MHHKKISNVKETTGKKQKRHLSYRKLSKIAKINPPVVIITVIINGLAFQGKGRDCQAD